MVFEFCHCYQAVAVVPNQREAWAARGLKDADAIGEPLSRILGAYSIFGCILDLEAHILSQGILFWALNGAGIHSLLFKFIKILK